jgi:hypothetical protein
MATWPVIGDVETWLSGQSISSSTVADRLPFAFEAALEVVQDDVDVTLFPTYDADTPTVYDVPHRLRLGVILFTHKLLTRADSPSGVIGFADFAIRVSNEDPDYHKLVGRYKLPGFG